MRSAGRTDSAPFAVTRSSLRGVSDRSAGKNPGIGVTLHLGSTPYTPSPGIGARPQSESRASSQHPRGVSRPGHGEPEKPGMTTTNPSDDCCHPQGGATAKTGVHCPACGMKGRAVNPITINALVTEQARAKLRSSEGFRFCAEPSCNVAYFHHDSGERFLRSDVRVRIGQKENGSPRVVCYCFDHTTEEIQAEVLATGTSAIADAIGDKCKQGLDRCEETNPQGTCCLGNVRALVRNVLDTSSPVKQENQR